MRLVIAGILLSFMLVGCVPSLIAGNSAGGVVRMPGTINGMRQAAPLADAECQKFGEIAKLHGVNDIHGTMRFDCVTPQEYPGLVGPMSPVTVPDEGTVTEPTT